MKKNGFTLVELMVVIAILGILATIVTSAAFGAMKSARERRRSAMASVLREGIATYYARNGKWPGGIESRAEKGEDHVFRRSESDNIFREVVKGSVGKKNPYLDPHALFVAPSGTTDGRGLGVPFSDARKKNPPPHIRRLNIEEMSFGYQDPSSGKFRRFWVVYHAAADSVDVTWPSNDREEAMNDGYERENE